MGTFIAEISTSMHLIAGAVLFVFAAFEVFAALKPGNKIPALGSFLLFAGGTCGGLFMFNKAGGTPDAFFNVLSKESVFMLFTGFFILLCTSGLIGIMQYLSKNIPGFWKLFQMFLFCLMAACFYVYPQFYPGDAFNEQLHMVMSCSVIAGALVNAINIMLKNKAAAFISVFCFFIAGTLLVQFREDPKVFSRQQEYTSSMSSFSGNINLGPVSAVQK